MKKATHSENPLALHLAINMRAGIEPIGYQMPYGEYGEAEPMFVSDVKATHYEATNETTAPYWDYDEIRIQVIRGRQLTKAEFKKEYSSFRNYLRNSNKD